MDDRDSEGQSNENNLAEGQTEEGQTEEGDAPAAPLSRLHPLTLLLEIPSLLFGWVGPFVLVGVIGSRSETFFSRTFRFAMVGVAIGTTAALIRYFTLRYGVQEGHLLVRSGLLQRSTRSVPIAQIHNVDLRARPLQRLLGVREVRIETAGGHGAEAHLRVVGAEEAERLRSAVLHREDTEEESTAPSRSTAANAISDESAEGDAQHIPSPNDDPISVHLDPSEDHADQTADEPQSPRSAPARPTTEVDPRWRIRFRELLVAGATENRVGPIAAGLVGLQEILDDSGFDVPRFIEGMVVQLFGQGATSTMLILGALVLLFLIAGWFVSIVLTWITWHGFTLERSGVDLKRSHGLLSRFEALISVPRVQVLLFQSTWLRRWIGYVAVRVQTAGSPMQGAGGSAVLFPLLQSRNARALGRLVFSDLKLDEDALLPVHPRSRRRGFVRYFLGLALIVGVAALIKGLPTLGLLAVAPLPAWWMACARYRALGYHIGDRFLVARSGVLTRNLWVVPIDRIQTVAWKQNPFQRRAGLASIAVNTAGAAQWSAATIVDLAERDAEGLWLRLAHRTGNGAEHGDTESV